MVKVRGEGMHYANECPPKDRCTNVYVCVRTYLEGLVYGREIANTLTYCSATKLA